MSGLELKYFVLKPKGNSDYAFASRMAMIAYAANIKKTNPQLANDLHEWIQAETENKATK